MSNSHLINSTSGAAIFSRIFETSQETLPPDLARYILGLGFSAADRGRMQELAAKNQQDNISPQELEELDNYITAGDILAIWQSKARQALKPCPTAPRHG
jgi:hypothetical protein